MKILILAGFDNSLLNFRGPLIRAVVAAGHEVVACAPVETADVGAKLARMGVRLVPVILSRAGMNPLADLRYRRMLRGIMLREAPDVVLAYTIKPVVHGIPVARRAGVKRCYALITGLGAAFHTEGFKGWVLQLIASKLYRRALRACDLIMVQNRDIAACFTARGITTAASNVLVVAGSGIDTAVFTAQPMPHGPPVFLLLARMLRDKGVEEFVAAARIVRKSYPAAKFLLVGDTDPNPAAIPLAQLLRWSRDGVVEYHPAVVDVRPVLAQCTVYVLPSYHEGMPRSVLEAMATARPVITTDTIGCRETILSASPVDKDRIRIGRNGLLVPIKDSLALAKAMLRLANDHEASGAMGAEGRRIAEQQFDVHRINDVMLRAMNLLPCKMLEYSVAAIRN